MVSIGKVPFSAKCLFGRIGGIKKFWEKKIGRRIQKKSDFLCQKTTFLEHFGEHLVFEPAARKKNWRFGKKKSAKPPNRLPGPPHPTPGRRFARFSICESPLREQSLFHFGKILWFAPPSKRLTMYSFNYFSYWNAKKKYVIIGDFFFDFFFAPQAQFFFVVFLTIFLHWKRKKI